MKLSVRIVSITAGHGESNNEVVVSIKDNPYPTGKEIENLAELVRLALIHYGIPAYRQ